MVDGKIRIYDLAREKTPKDYDEKVQKKIQAEITRQVIAVAPEFDQFPKTASSSIDDYAVEKILEKVSISSIIEEVTSKGSKTGGARRVVKKTEEKAAEPAKKKIRIVRRLSATPEEEEKKEEPEAEEAKVEEKAPDPDIIQPIQEEPEEDKVDHVQEMLQNMEKAKTPKAPAKPASSVSLNKLNKVKSIPLRPSMGGHGQPYRVAKPSMVSQGIGRKKKKLSPEEKQARKTKVKEVVEDETIKELHATEAMTVRELAQKMGIPETNIISYFFSKGIIKTVNEILEKSLIVEFAESQDYLVYTEEDTSKIGAELRSTLAEDESEGNLINRPPIVTIMGHVDHGKTTLLDAVRATKINVTEGEAGGITQHIGAYQIATQDYDGNDRRITFLDTPGHEAFTAMRQRGAFVTDIVILVVAADDGLMPQTIEAINHTKAAKVPFIVAINKMDKPEANPDKVMGQLAEHEIVVEQYGGPIVCSQISAKTGKNLEELLEKIVLVADAELDEKIRSNPSRAAIGSIIEAELLRAKGPMATALVQNGTLHKGDCISAGGVYGKVKAMFDDMGEEVEAAGPSTPVKILGLSGVPNAGDTFKAHKNTQEAKKAAEEVAHQAREEKRLRGLSAFASGVKEGQVSEMQVIIKADVQGSAEAVAQELNKLSTDEVLVKPIEVSSGSITTNDVELAERTKATILGFHVGADAATAKLAQKLEVEMKTYEIIYKLTEDMRRKVLGLHAPEIEEVQLGFAEVRQIFTIGKAKKVAGCYVKEGKVVRNEIARVIREGVQIYEGKVDYLKRFKDDAKEVKENTECGLSFEKYNDLQDGDVIECWTVKEIARTSL